ncbi:hypothetical protein M0R45_031298 [Rubus argutus]|uniref:RBR-type E3 ubiquitin transferase n=1 Tax=Rubus argutus TaxID=59490 RepID=A0AAW1WGU5_RUBAR
MASCSSSTLAIQAVQSSPTTHEILDLTEDDLVVKLLLASPMSQRWHRPFPTQQLQLHHMMFLNAYKNVLAVALATEYSFPQADKVKEYLEQAEAEKSSQIIQCGICVELKESNQMFTNNTCAHSFCSDCITKQVAAKLDENFHIVSCPGLDCKSVLQLEDCIPILPKLVLERWNEALCQALVLGSEKLYCPFRDCSMVLVIEDEREVVRGSECPACHRLFCAECRVPWHPGVDCEEFQRLNEDERGRDDLMVNQLAKDNKWMRCPRCKFFVEKTQGCPHITCRCQFQFCYGCGAEWTSNPGGCQSQCNRN